MEFLSRFVSLVLIFIAFWSEYIVCVFLILEFWIFFVCGLKYAVFVNVPRPFSRSNHIEQRLVN